MFEIFTEGFSLLNLLSLLAFVTTIGLFFCGIPICRQILKRGDTKEISGAPFLMGVVGGSCWFAYGHLKHEETVMYVTGTQIILYTTYTIFYWIMSKDKFWITLKVLGVVGICVILVTSIYFFGMRVYHIIGLICVTLNAADFAAPLAGLKVVIRRRATSTLPLPLCIANFLVSSEWFLYGIIIQDYYLIMPNGIGCFFATSQIILFIVLPRKPGAPPPIVKLFRFLRSGCRSEKKDPETTKVTEASPEEGNVLTRARRWSKKVANELEKSFEKAGVPNQFGFTIGFEPTVEEPSIDFTRAKTFAGKGRRNHNGTAQIEDSKGLRVHIDIPIRKVASLPHLAD